ncbi:cAMP-dependent protein kinase regulatory subunit [Martiniozyma asiatica (nom. inval.)]|nr:cAMP-dependent protein kinase regulatory subunit [Martiniozyma asiatica]
MDSHDPLGPPVSQPQSTPRDKPQQQQGWTAGFGAAFAASLPKNQLNMASHRRTSVSAEALNPHAFNDNWRPPVHQLSHSQLQRLNASVVKNFLFQQLDDESLKTIIFALEEKHVPKDTEIITQGEEGDFFYVVEKGSVDYVVNGQKVNTSNDGSSFGELALMYNSPRAATVIANTDCILWALDRMTFRRILLEGTSKKRAMYENFLREVPVLQSLSNYERSKLADALTRESYQKGQNVVTEGEAGENFYFIENGEADVIKDGEGVVATLTKGDYFGELALLYDSPRQATVKATGDLKVVSLNKSGFQRLLGPAVQVLKLHDPTKQ